MGCIEWSVCHIKNVPLQKTAKTCFLCFHKKTKKTLYKNGNTSDIPLTVASAFPLLCLSNIYG